MRRIGQVIVGFAVVLAGLALPQAAYAGTLGSAYVWADQFDNPSYTPNLSYQYNSTGAVNTITHSMVGKYTVNLPNLGGQNGTVLVSAYGTTDHHCKTAGWHPGSPATTQTVDVRCFELGGTPANSRFTMSFTNRLAGEQAWLWADQPTRTDTYSPSLRWQANYSEALNQVTRLDVGQYLVDVPTAFTPTPHRAGHVHVTAYGTGPELCVPGGPYGTSGSPTHEQIYVYCSAGGHMADSSFALTWVHNGDVLGATGSRSMYLMSWDGSTETQASGYNWDGWYSSGGGSLSVTHVSLGKYTVHSTVDSYLTGGTVQVNSRTWSPCVVESWGPINGITVGCYSSPGVRGDSGFYLSFVKP